MIRDILNTTSGCHHIPAPCNWRRFSFKKRYKPAEILGVHRHHRHRHQPHQLCPLHVCRATDYAANSVDDTILRLSARTELQPEQIKNVYGYPRNVHEKYTFGQTIGAGSYGVVRECTDLATGQLCAVKTISKFPNKKLPTPRYLIKIRAEVEIMEQLGNSLDAVNLKGAFEDDSSVHLVMELCSGGALLDRLKAEAYNERFIARIVRSILRFISQCHAKGVIYRDVKPDNFLFKSMDPDSPLKATDFGLSIKHSSDEQKLTCRSGTAVYMAPELINQSYDEKCDVWSVGMMTYQLLTGRFPFWEDTHGKSVDDVFAAVTTAPLNWDAPELQELSGPAIDFLQHLLERNPAKRLTAVAALEHSWIAQSGAAADKALGGSVVQRLQRFSTYGALKQMVLKIMVDEMASDSTQVQAAKQVPLEGSAELLNNILESKLKQRGGRSLRETLPVVDLFKQMDSDCSGNISQEELMEGLRSQGYILTDAEVEQFMRRADLDNNGSISLMEFVTTLTDWSKLQRSHGWQSLVDSAFERLDQDGNGCISVAELVEHVKSVNAAGCGGPASEEEVLIEAKQLLREADIDGDGQVSKLEFVKLLEDQYIPDNLSCYDDRLPATECPA